MLCCFLFVCFCSIIFSLLKYLLAVMNLVATHHNCTSPWDCLPPALTHCSASVFDSAFSTLPSMPLPDICLFWPCTNKAASGSTLASDLSFVTEDFAKDESSSKIDVTPPGYKVHWGLCRRLPRTGTPYSLWQHLLNDIFSWGLIWTSSFNHAAAWS